MNIEKELLKRMLDVLRGLEETHYDLYWDIQAELDKPEQEPVAWIYEWAVRSSFDASFTGEWKEELSKTKPDGTVKGFNPTKIKSTVRNLVPLYTIPPKCEPAQTAREMYQRGYAAGVRFAEKAHGIGETK